MLAGIHGVFLSRTFAEQRFQEVFAGRIGSSTLESAWHAFGRWHAEHLSRLYLVSSVRSIHDAACGLAECLMFDVGATAVLSDGVHAVRLRAGTTVVCLLSTTYGGDLGVLWRVAVRHAIVMGARWAFCFNGMSLRLIDVERSYSRAHLEFELEPTMRDRETFRVFWGAVRAEAFARTSSSPALIEEIRDASARHSESVCRSLRTGVRDALIQLLQVMVNQTQAQRNGDLRNEVEQCLTLIYRVLFLLFAEARGLVPVWHPIYRPSYTVEALRDIVESSERPTGLWDALSAMSRLAHDGCQAGSLMVAPFNGRLFAPEHAPLAEHLDPDDEVVRRVLLALSTRPVGTSGRERIAYRDLGVEQLGAVYESVLDYKPAWISPTRAESIVRRDPAGVVLRPDGGGRKASGTFYTPRSLTDFLVRRTLAPLVSDASSDEVLQIRVVDPAMGSGAFLVAACRYLAAAYEAALVREGRIGSSEITDEDRAGFRRLVAQRCLFGVDLNPTAVHLARLSMWLVTMARDQPLTFLDHHLLAGNSLLGASRDDVMRRAPPARTAARTRPSTLSLFDDSFVADTVRDVLPVRSRMALQADDTLDAVRSKEELLRKLNQPASILARSKAAFDLWCACWFWPNGDDAPGKAFGELMSAVLGRQSVLQGRTLSAFLSTARSVSTAWRFFHWHLEFPEVFFDQDGRARASGGFDAVIGNPPWDVLRADSPDGVPRDRLKDVVRFVRDSGVYSLSRDGHANSYQLFVERALSLLRNGGRLGLVVPSGLALDAGSTRLRRQLVDKCDTDMLVGFENRRRIFPVHRSIRFLLMTSTNGAVTRSIGCRFGEDDPGVLDAVADRRLTTVDEARAVQVSPTLIRRLSGESLVIPDFRSALDVRIHEGVASRCPMIGALEGWNLRFGRELNASDDRDAFSSHPGPIAVVEGKQLTPFTVDLSKTRRWIEEPRALALAGSSSQVGRERLAYRDVASPTNRLTLIAAILPAGVVSTHTVFCLKTEVDRDIQIYLCGVFNSYVANYLIRARISTHVTVASIGRLPVPPCATGTRSHEQAIDLGRTLLSARGAHSTATARLQALVARLYGVSREEFTHILSTFPLIPAVDKAMALSEFDQLA